MATAAATAAAATTDTRLSLSASYTYEDDLRQQIVFVGIAGGKDRLVDMWI